jgi:hypothetical protein
MTLDATSPFVADKKGICSGLVLSLSPFFNDARRSTTTSYVNTINNKQT